MTALWPLAWRADGWRTNPICDDRQRDRQDQCPPQLRIIELFSEGLYASPNKAVEERVANSLDAGAQTVLVILSTNLHDQDASIVVIDDGEGMGVEGCKTLPDIAEAFKNFLRRE